MMQSCVLLYLLSFSSVEITIPATVYAQGRYKYKSVDTLSSSRYLAAAAASLPRMDFWDTIWIEKWIVAGGVMLSPSSD